MLDPSSMSTVFELMEESCVELMKLSTSVSSQEGGYSTQISHRQLYYRILWSEFVTKYLMVNFSITCDFILFIECFLF